MVAHEADRIAGSTPPHQIRLDTKAEENAWNSRILSVVQLLLPDDSRRLGWESAFQKWALSSFLRPADEQSPTMVDGRTVAAQFTGANIHDDFTLENHDIVHPDYMTCISLSLGAELDYALSGRRPPECLHYNVAEIYENLKWFMLPDGGFVYPNGQDWQLFRNADWTVTNVMMAVLPRDPDAWSLACPCVDTLEKMQARSKTGAVYAPGETFFASTQTDLLSSLATSWLVLKTADRIERAPHDRVGVRRLDSGKIILRRTGSAIHTVSWGPQVMAQCVPVPADRIVSPDQRNGIGHIVLADQQKSLPIHLHDAKVTSGEDWFKAELVVDHGEHIRAELLFASNQDGSFTMREKLVALTDIATSRIATGQIGILNNPGWVYERGRRAIAIDGREEDVPALSGKTLGAEAVREIVVDGVLRIRGAQPLRIQYQGAEQPSRSRATDLLYLNSRGRPAELAGRRDGLRVRNRRRRGTEPSVIRPRTQPKHRAAVGGKNSMKDRYACWTLLWVLPFSGLEAFAASSLVEQLGHGVYEVRDDGGQWPGDMSRGITHQSHAAYQAKKVLDLSDVSDDVWRQTREARLSAFFMVRDYSGHDNKTPNGLDEAFEVAVNGKVHRYSTNCGAPVFGEGKPPAIGWYDFVLPKEDFVQGRNEVILRKAASDKNDDYLYLGIDESQKRGNSYVAFDGKTWTQDKLTVPGGNGEYMVRLYLLARETACTVRWQPGQPTELDDPAKVILYAGARHGEATPDGLRVPARRIRANRVASAGTGSVATGAGDAGRHGSGAVRVAG